jgi:hypothetical protein
VKSWKKMMKIWKILRCTHFFWQFPVVFKRYLIKDENLILPSLLISHYLVINSLPRPLGFLLQGSNSTGLGTWRWQTGWGSVHKGDALWSLFKWYGANRPQKHMLLVTDSAVARFLLWGTSWGQYKVICNVYIKYIYI